MKTKLIDGLKVVASAVSIGAFEFWTRLGQGLTAHVTCPEAEKSSPLCDSHQNSSTRISNAASHGPSFTQIDKQHPVRSGDLFLALIPAQYSLTSGYAEPPPLRLSFRIVSDCISPQESPSDMGPIPGVRSGIMAHNMSVRTELRALSTSQHQVPYIRLCT